MLALQFGKVPGLSRSDACRNQFIGDLPFAGPESLPALINLSESAGAVWCDNSRLAEDSPQLIYKGVPLSIIGISRPWHPKNEVDAHINLITR